MQLFSKCVAILLTALCAACAPTEMLCAQTFEASESQSTTAESSMRSAHIEEESRSSTTSKDAAPTSYESEHTATNDNHDAAITAVDKISTVILLQEIDLERFYTSYRIVGSKEPNWRHARYFWAQEAAASLFVASQTIGMVEAAKGLHNPDGSSVRALKNSSVCGLIATVLEGGSSGLELASNATAAAKHRKLKTDPESARRIFVERLKAVDALINERNQILTLSGTSKALPRLDLEGRVLKFFRDRCLYEFADLYADVHSYQSSNNVYYVIDVAGCSLFVASYVLGLVGFSRPDLNGPSYISAIAADGPFIVSAQASVYAYNKIYKHYYDKLSKQVGETLYDAEPKAEASVRDLEKVLGSTTSTGAPDDVVTRIGIYKKWAGNYDQFIEKREVELRRMSKVSRQSEIMGPLLGGCFLEADIIGTNASYHLTHNPRAANGNAFAGLVPTVVSTVASAATTAGYFIDDELHARKLKREGALPSELLDKRMTVLKGLEDTLKR